MLCSLSGDFTVNNKISILIPTRNRAGFILSTINSCLAQEDGDLEIIVSNNCSDDATRELVLAVCDPRLKYIETTERLSMCDHWDYAFNFVTGKYLMVMGDDDAVLPGGVAVLRRQLNEADNSIIMWDAPVFNWPAADGIGGIVTCHKKSKTKFVPYDDKITPCLLHGGFRYMNLPKLYHSLVKVDLLKEIRNKNGRLFHSTQPDLFMAFTLPNFQPGYLFLGEPVTIYGNSAKMMQTSIKEFVDTKSNLFFSEYKNYRFEKSLDIQVPPLMIMIADAILKAISINKEYYINKRLNMSAMWAASLRTYRCMTFFDFIKTISVIKSVGQFSTPVFLFYVCIHKFMASKKLVLNKFVRKPAVLNSCPKADINDAAKWLVSQGKLPNWSSI